MNLRAKLSVGIMLIVSNLITVVPTFAQGPNDFHEDWSFTEFVPCANGGAGEWIGMTGTIHFVEVDGVFHANLQNASGVGQMTGDVYRAIGAAQEIFHWIDGAEVFGIIDNFRLIGPGPGNNLVFRAVFHVTINANGDVTAVVDTFSVECH